MFDDTVTDGMAIGIVNTLKTVQIEQRNAQFIAITLTAQHLFLQAAHGFTPVQQRGQRITGHQITYHTAAADSRFYGKQQINRLHRFA